MDLLLAGGLLVVSSFSFPSLFLLLMTASCKILCDAVELFFPPPFFPFLFSPFFPGKGDSIVGKKDRRA